MKLEGALSLGLGLLLAACGSDETTPFVCTPNGPPSLAIVSPAGEEGPVCVSIGADPSSARVPVLVAIEELSLKPPGLCPCDAQCGHLAIYADGVLNNEAPTRAIDLLLGRIADPYRDGTVHAGTSAPDVLRVRVEIVDGDGEVLTDHDGEPLADEVELITVASCE